MKKYTRQIWERGAVEDLSAQIADDELAKLKLKDSPRIIALLLTRLGGSVTLDELELIKASRDEIIVSQDVVTRATTLTLRKK